MKENETKNCEQSEQFAHQTEVKLRGTVVSTTIEKQIEKELEFIKCYPKWACAWWTPEYFYIRAKELMQDSQCRNRDILYLEGLHQMDNCYPKRSFYTESV
jgi:hypothetical protein